MKLIRIITIFFALLLCTTIGCQPVQEKSRKQNLGRIACVVEEEIKKGNIPGAVVLVGQDDNILYHKAFGCEVNEPYQERMGENTVFDLASLTKPVATAASVMVLVDQDRIKLTDYVSTYLPVFAQHGKQEVQIGHLLTHTSGLPAYTNVKELKEQFGSPCPDKVIEKIYNLKLLSKPGKEFRYSCLGYITLANIVELVSGKNVNDFSRENIFAPLGMEKTTFNPVARPSWPCFHGLEARATATKDIAATEIVDGRLLRGTVHDPLARLMGGISGNAGLFSTAYDLSTYCRMLLNGGTWKRIKVLSPEAVAMLTTAQSHGRAYGFDVHSSYSWVKGSYASEEAFCHTGYTGTSIVCDPVRKVYVIILTNRAHPHDKGSSKPIRKNIADIVFQAYE